MYKKIYFIGIKGVGMMGLAVIAKQAGIAVGGSDVEEEFITDKVLSEQKLSLYKGFKKENVNDFFQGLSSKEGLVIATGAHGGFDNEEAVEARRLGYKVISHGEAVGLFMKGQIFGREDIEGISVSGSHGKTTVSGMLAVVLSEIGLDPSYTVGTSEIFPLGPAGHYGLGKYFIAEADEYVAESKYDPIPKFIYQKPAFLIINNIDFDHPDFYSDIQAVENAYLDFVSNLDNNGLLVANGDDVRVRNIIGKIQKPKIITFGTGENNDFRVTKFSQNGTNSYFSIETKDMVVDGFCMSVPGYHNAKNAAGLIALLVELGIPIRKIQDALPKFLGVKRRMEKVGETENFQLIIDDYAHHPAEIRKTLNTLKLAYPDKKILTIFQPHTFSRTQALLPDFISSLSMTDELILLPTFASKRDETDNQDYDKTILEEARKISKNTVLLKLPDVVEYIRKNKKDKDILILTMGAGDVYKIAYSLKK